MRSPSAFTVEPRTGHVPTPAEKSLSGIDNQLNFAGTDYAKSGGKHGPASGTPSPDRADYAPPSPAKNTKGDAPRRIVNRELVFYEPPYVTIKNIYSDGSSKIRRVEERNCITQYRVRISQTKTLPAQELGAFIYDEIRQWEQIFKAAGIEVRTESNGAKRGPRPKNS